MDAKETCIIFRHLRAYHDGNAYTVNGYKAKRCVVVVSFYVSVVCQKVLIAPVGSCG